MKLRLIVPFPTKIEELRSRVEEKAEKVAREIHRDTFKVDNYNR